MPEQGYHLEKNFPRFLSAIHMILGGLLIFARRVTDNLYDEEHSRIIIANFGLG